MKDPLCKEDTPYDVLGVNNDISLKEVNQAFGDYLKNRKGTPQKGMVARNKLRNPKERIEVDAFCYDIEEKQIEVKVDESGLDVDSLLVRPDITIRVPETDLNKADYSKDNMPVKFGVMTVLDIKTYDDINGYEMKAVFDR